VLWLLLEEYGAILAHPSTLARWLWTLLAEGRATTRFRFFDSGDEMYVPPADGLDLIGPVTRRRGTPAAPRWRSRVRWIAAAVVTALAAAFATLALKPTYPELGAGGIMVNDFERGDRLNTLDYCPERFTDSSNLATVSSTPISVPAETLRNTGRSLRIVFDVSSTQTAEPFGGYVETLTGNDPCPSDRGLFNLDAMNKTALTFWVRRPDPDVDMEIALKSISPNPNPQRADDIETDPKVLLSSYATRATSWEKIRIPIVDLLPAGRGRRVDTRNLRQITFAFAKRRFQEAGGALSGTIFLDEIAF
jgi:hypothetical protein